MKQLVELMGSKVADTLVGTMILRLAQDPYLENVFELVSTTILD